ncbi:MAG: DNA primase, partial [Flavobacteriales bacterium]
MIPRETIEKIVNAAAVEEVVGDYVTLKKRGVNHVGLCPFHDEKTPSFTVSPSKGIYKCFGCGAGGNAVNFLMQHEQLSYPEALKLLAKKYGIEIEEQELTPEQKEEQSERESLFIVSAFAKDFFTEYLHNSQEGQAIGLSYLRERGMSDEMITQFELGYAPESNDMLLRKAQEAGYKEDYLIKTGLAKKGEHGMYDGYRGRIMFPIHNLSGRVVGFGGRALKQQAKAKYINTPDCAIYNKRALLYGLYFAKRQIT